MSTARHGILEVFIDQRRDTSVRVDFQKLWFLLVGFLERKGRVVVGDFRGAVRLDELFEVDGGFESVRGGLGVEVEFGRGGFRHRGGTLEWGESRG